MPDASRDDWYRSADWDEASQAEFATRLARARPSSRVQYRRIKALALLGSGDATRAQAGRELLDENLATPDLMDFERTVALTALARHDRASGRLTTAVRAIRSALAAGPDANGTTGEEEIELAELLLESGGDADLAEAKQLLDRRASDPPLFVRSRYRLAVAQARACERRGDRAGARRWAGDALDLAATTDSGLRKHPDLGLPEPTDDDLAWLRRLAGPDREA